MPVIVKLSKEYGFCFGVKRALDRILKLKGRIKTLGPLIHNPQEIEKLKKRGILPISSLREINKGILVIRAHGVADKIIDRAKGKNLQIVDLTCPYVKKMQSLAKILEKQHYQVFIIGSRKHPEVKAVTANLKSPRVIESVKDIYGKAKLDKIGIICQTTSNIQNVNNIIAHLKKRSIVCKVYDTVCEATKERQKAAKELAMSVEMMIVVGGRKSSNTKKLAEVCEKFVPTHHIETEKDIKKKWFKGIKTVGVTAGASTPNWLIDKVVKYIRAM